ncbi:hypothetical protein CDL15_Pgr010183 [Punica granatum]|uniref:Uncharacterized protein n=1 Tax=Punica granatum TaxID=22663 RepID=A0A218XRJ6_PUNGR|nr:hypothetical protein CDL15_Pgr010183 [Punica granatum]
MKHERAGFGELAKHKRKLARVSRSGKIARGASEQARRTCEASKKTRTGEQTWQGCKKDERAYSANLRDARTSRPGKVARSTSEQARQTYEASKKTRTGEQTWQGGKRRERAGSANL